MAVSEELKAMLRPQERSAISKFAEIGGAFAASQRPGGQGVGQTLAQNKQLRLQEQGQQFQQSATIAGLEQKEQDSSFAQIKYAAERGDVVSRQVMDAFKVITSGLNTEDASLVWTTAEKSEVDITDGRTAASVFSNIINELGLTKQFKPDKKSSSDFVNVWFPDTKETIGVDLTDPQNRAMVKSRKGQIVSKQVTGTEEEVGLGLGQDKVTLRRFAEVETAARGFIQGANRLSKALEDPKLVLGSAGAILTKLSGFGQQAKQVARAMNISGGGNGHFDYKTGEELTAEQLLDPRRYNFKGMRAVARANVKVQSEVIGLAYLLARSNDPGGGRLSDFDVEISLQELGLKSNDPEIIRDILMDKVGKVIDNVQNFATSIGRDFEFTDMPAFETRNPYIGLTTEQIAVIPREDLSQRQILQILEALKKL